MSERMNDSSHDEMDKGEDITHTNPGLEMLNENNIRLPIVEHNEKLKGCIDEIEKVGGSKQEIQNGKNFIYQTRIDLSNLERMERESAGDNTKLLLDETARMEKEFKRLSDVEGAESNFLKQQIQQLNAEKFKINQNVAVLEERVRETELEVGMKNL